MARMQDVQVEVRFVGQEDMTPEELDAAWAAWWVEAAKAVHRLRTLRDHRVS